MAPGHMIDNAWPPPTATNNRFLKDALTRHLQDFVPTLRDEVVVGFNRTLSKGKRNQDGYWYLDTCLCLALTGCAGSTTISLQQLLSSVVVAVCCRVLVGSNLCRDENFLTAVVDYIWGMATGSFLVSLFPRPLRP